MEARCQFCRQPITANTDIPGVCDECRASPTRAGWFRLLHESQQKWQEHTSPDLNGVNFAAFCNDPENHKGFKPARVARWLEENEKFVCDEETDILYHYDAKLGIWVENGEIYLQKILAKILGDENRETYYRNILHALKGLTYKKIEWGNQLVLDNGVLDPYTAVFSESNPNMFPRYRVHAKYDPSAKCPKWMAFIKQILPEDDALALQEWSGYLLLPDYRFQLMAFFYGTGRNGKGVWARTMQALLSECTTTFRLSDMNDNARFSLQRLYGKLFAICSEPAMGKVLSTEVFKRLTGQDMIHAEQKGKNKLLCFLNVAKITIIANRFPRVYDDTIAFWDRLLIIRFPYNFTGSKQIQNIEETWLSDPQERSGILNWMLEGLYRLLKNRKFTNTKSQRETQIEFQRNSDTIGAFIQECIVPKSDSVITRKQLYMHYKSYCETHDIPIEREEAFTRRIKAIPRVTECRVGVNRERAWRGIQVNKDEQEDGLNETSETSETSETPLLPKVFEEYMEKLNESADSYVSPVSSPTQLARITSSLFPSERCAKCQKIGVDYQATYPDGAWKLYCHQCAQSLFESKINSE